MEARAESYQPSEISLDMRHTFASHLVIKGVDLNTVRELLGHTDYQMTLCYSHLAPEHKAAAVLVAA
jgi:site-specific recombinase XerD